MGLASFPCALTLGASSGTTSGTMAVETGILDTRFGRSRTCCLPSGLSPSVPEFHQVHRPLAAVGSRTVTAGSELHRPRSTSGRRIARWRPGFAGDLDHPGFAQPELLMTVESAIFKTPPSSTSR